MIDLEDDRPGLKRLQLPALALGILGLIGCVVGALGDSEQFFRSYLHSFIFWGGIAVGSMAILMIQHLTGGDWGVIMRRPLEASTRTMPFVALLFVPVALGIHALYLWSHDEVVAKDAVLQSKAAYLDEGFFIGRSVFYFLLWMTLAFLLLKFTREHEHSGSAESAFRMRKVSGPGLLLLGFSISFASIDWLMSLEPHWYSTMYGISFTIGFLLTAHAFTLLMVILLSRKAPYGPLVRPIHFRDMGNLMFAFILLWAYTGFSQFMLIWYANLAEETPWFLKRIQGAWGWVAWMLVIFHFFVPFFLLLMRGIKDRPKLLGSVAAFILFMRLVDLLWIIKPAFHHGEGLPHFSLHWMDVATFLAVGGLWFALFLRNLSRRSLLPSYEPLVQGGATSHG